MDSEEALATATRLSRQRQHDELLVFLDQHRELKDQSWWHELRADALEALSRYEEAWEAYDRAIALSPDDHQLILLKGELLLDDLGRYDEAISCFDAVIARFPSAADGYFFKAWALMTKEQWSAAAGVLRTGLDRCPGDADLQGNLRYVLTQLNKPARSTRKGRDSSPRRPSLNRKSRRSK